MSGVVQRCCVSLVGWCDRLLTTKYMRAVLFLLMGGLALSQVWLAHLRVEDAREKHHVRLEIERIQSDMAKLSIEYANLTRPERLRDLAHRQLGMHAPRPDQVVRP